MPFEEGATLSEVAALPLQLDIVQLSTVRITNL